MAALAELKRLPLDLLKGEGWTDMSYQGNPAVRIPHLDVSGTATSTHYRTRLSPRDYRWKTGDKAVPYGLHRLDSFPRDKIIVCEGESDVLTLWHHGLSAIGVPGAGCWTHIGGTLDDFDQVVVIVEPDTGGDGFRGGFTLDHYGVAHQALGDVQLRGGLSLRNLRQICRRLQVCPLTLSHIRHTTRTQHRQTGGRPSRGTPGRIGSRLG